MKSLARGHREAPDIGKLAPVIARHGAVVAGPKVGALASMIATATGRD